MIYNIRFDIYLGTITEAKQVCLARLIRTCLSTPQEVLEYFGQSTSVLPAEYRSNSMRSTVFSAVLRVGNRKSPAEARVSSGDIQREIKTLNLACLDENR